MDLLNLIPVSATILKQIVKCVGGFNLKYSEVFWSIPRARKYLPAALIPTFNCFLNSINLKKFFKSSKSHST